MATNMSFEKIFLCGGFTNSQLIYTNLALESSHLFRITSLDSCLAQNKKFHWKPKKMRTDQKMVAILF